MRWPLLLVPALLLLACVPVASAPAVQIDGAHDAAIAAEWRGQALVLEIRSETGIGSAQVTLPEEAPRDIVLRLHLRGLEELRFAYAEGSVRVSVSSTDEPLVRAEMTRTGETEPQPLAAGDPGWMDVGILGGTIPLEEGYFDVRVPEEFLQGGHRAFTLSWIDFYR